MSTRIRIDLEIKGDEYPVTVFFDYDAHKFGRLGAIDIQAVVFEGRDSLPILTRSQIETVSRPCWVHVAGAKNLSRHIIHQNCIAEMVGA